MSTPTDPLPVETTVDSNGEPLSVSSISDLIAQHGSSTSTVWLEFDRYSIWRPPPSAPISESAFPPIQGYMQRDPFVFAWGNPVLSSPSALEPTAAAFIRWVESRDLQPIWACVNEDLEHILGSTFKWCTVTCIQEDVVSPSHVVHMVEEDTGSSAKDLKKNIRRAERQSVVVTEVQPEELTEEDRKQVEAGIEEWKETKSGSLAASSLYPWLDQEHHRYWLARRNNDIVGLLILSQIANTSYQIKNAISFPAAPKGTSEELIYSALKGLNSAESEGKPNEITVNFGISASDNLEPVQNLSGWKVTWLSRLYASVTRGARLVQRGEFRSKFDASQEPMYVCYPEDGLGFEGVHALLKLLRK